MAAARIGIRCLSRASPLLRQAPRAKPFLSSFRQQRSASYQQFPGRGGRQGSGSGPQYSSFRPAARAQFIWYNYQRPIIGLTAAGGVFYVYNLETVPISGRRRFNCISPELEKKIVGDAGYSQILQQYQGKILPENHPYTQLVAKVVSRLLPSTGGLAGDEWTVHVIDEPREKNAFVMPGGKVFVFTGILPICQDEDGVAAVIGHEIAHNVAHHTAEKLSRSVFVVLLAIAAMSVFDISGGSSKFLVDLIFSLPNSRTQESEADHIGLLMMAQSCFDPNSATDFWKRMAESERAQGTPPQFMSTHPSSSYRADKISAWLPEANAKLEDSNCGATGSYANEFKRAFAGSGPENPSGTTHRPRPQPWNPSQQSKSDDDEFW